MKRKTKKIIEETIRGFVFMWAIMLLITFIALTGYFTIKAQKIYLVNLLAVGISFMSIIKLVEYNNKLSELKQ